MLHLKCEKMSDLYIVYQVPMSGKIINIYSNIFCAAIG